MRTVTAGSEIVKASRRRLYLMRHGEVAYFEPGGRPVEPGAVPLTAAGIEQARAAARALDGVSLDRVITSGMPRAVETARIVAPANEAETWPELHEIRGGRLSDIADHELEEAFTGALRGVVPEERRFLGGETTGSMLDRVLPAFERLTADTSWSTALAVLHGAVNRAILSYALTGQRLLLGGLEQAPGCINILDYGDADGWVVRAVNHAPYDPVHTTGRTTTMEDLLAGYLPFRQGP